MLFSYVEIHVFTGCRLQCTLRVFLYPVAVLFYVQLYTGLTLAKLGEVYVGVTGRVQISV